MTIHKYRTNEEYVQAQVAANGEKIGFVWVQSKNVKQIASRIERLGMKPRVGLCHGTRGGQEQKLFMKHLPRCAVVGTEIAPSAALFPLTICWDFHDPLWEGLCDFVYSNSFDHAADPERALMTWLASLAPDGVLIIEWGSYHEEATETDPFGATIEELLTLVEKCGGEILDVEDAAVKSEYATYLKLVYVQTKGGKKNAD